MQSVPDAPRGTKGPGYACACPRAADPVFKAAAATLTGQHVSKEMPHDASGPALACAVTKRSVWQQAGDHMASLSPAGRRRPRTAVVAAVYIAFGLLMGTMVTFNVHGAPKLAPHMVLPSLMIRLSYCQPVFLSMSIRGCSTCFDEA